MKRKIVLGLMASSLLVATLLQSIPVLAEGTEEMDSTYVSSEEYATETIESTVPSDVLSETLVTITNESLEEMLESSVLSSEESQATEASSQELFSESEEQQYEEVFYNGQWFKFPVQPYTEEPIVDPNANHELGNTVNTMLKSRSKADIITEDQKGRPKWDFIDVASYQSDLSVKDYEYMKKHGVTGVVVKLTEGTSYKNPYAQTQIENAKKAGLKVSTYHYSHFLTKEGAEAEAAYYAAEAKRLNLPSNTIMVNDIEENFNAFSTQNSIFFANKLKDLGYPTTMHYSYASAFERGLLASEMLGAKNLWIAQYPYQPSDKNILHTAHSAWQWSSSMKFTEIKNKTFDVNMDHTGMFSNRSAIEGEVEDIKPVSEKVINKYATITAKDFIFWNDFSFKKQNATSSQYFQKTLYVDKEYTYADGVKYVSVKDSNQKQIGIVDSRALTYATSRGGIYISHSLYVTVRSKNYKIWQNFNFSTTRGITGQYYDQTVQVRGKYHHFNGSIYYSLYTNDGKWIGYVDAMSVRQGSGQQGIHYKYGKFVTVKGNYNLWRNFSWNNQTKASLYKGQTIEARGYYNHFNGSRYLSLYDNKGKWLGYINERGVNTEKSRGGAALAAKFNKKIVKRNYTIWQDFGFSKKKANSNQYLNQTLYVAVQYRHFNGSTYYSLYNSKNQWLGYINANATK